MGIVSRRQAGPDVQELPDAIPGSQPVHRIDQEPAGEPGDQRQGRHDLQYLLRCLAVGGEVVLAAYPVVPHPGRIRHAGVEVRQFAAPHGGLVRRPALRHSDIPLSAGCHPRRCATA